VDISDSNVDTHVQQTIKEERGTQKEKHLKQKASSNVPEDGVPSSNEYGNVPPRVRSLAALIKEAQEALAEAVSGAEELRIEPLDQQGNPT
jgi:hypothetical protein